jgi:hypothetical protein
MAHGLRILRREIAWYAEHAVQVSGIGDGALPGLRWWRKTEVYY